METRQLNVLEGQYAPEEAYELLLKLIKNELQFHQLQNFTSLIRYDGSNEQAASNIRLLCQARDEIVELVHRARTEGLQISIDGTLALSLVQSAVQQPAKVTHPSL